MSPPDPPTAHQVDVTFAVEDGVAASWDESHVARLVRSLIARELPAGRYALDLHLVDDAAIRALNHVHRGKDTPTDVLSFPLHDPHGTPFVLPPTEPIALGDVVISYPRVLDQAASFGHSVERELGYLVAHGVLHVLGYDHELDADRVEMRRKEEEALAPLGFTR